jgi:acetyl-CoA C-acetyltransferase
MEVLPMKEIYAVSCCRTAVGKFQGSLSNTPASDMGAVVVKEALSRAGVKPEQVDEVMFGGILTGAQGQNPARQVCVKAGLPYSVPAYTVGMVCGSGMKSVIEGFRAIKADEADIVVCGGAENMTMAPYAMPAGRGGARMFDTTMVDTMVKDGLWDAFNNYHMGTTAENICDLWGITRTDLDEFAASSQAKTAAAQAAGKFDDEIVPVMVKQKKQMVEFKVDEFPRASTNFESLSKLKGAFPVGPESEAIQEQGRKIAAGDKNAEGPITLTFDATAIQGPAADAGTKRVTAGNASGVNDGAACIILASGEAVEKYGLKPMAKLVSYGQGGVDPKIMGVGPVPASRQAMARAGVTIDDIDLIEANEAFAAQSIAVARELKFDMSKVNVNGGAISIGHPVGASGARIIVTLLHEMQKREDAKLGLATLCIGGGMGVATIWEKC